MGEKFNLQGAPLEKIREYVSSLEGQKEVVSFVQHLRDTFPNNAGYEDVCKKAEENVLRVFTKDNFVRLFAKTKIFIEAMPPGHDAGHVYRDILGSIVLFLKDPAIKDAKYMSDTVAGLLASFHDIGNACVHRYEDTATPAGHAEVGAWIMYHFMLPDFGEYLSLITAWSIASHTHALRDIDTKWPDGKPYKRLVYPVELFESKGKLVGFGPKIMARGVDRMENTGVTLGVRHILAKGDAVEQNIKGKDLFGGSDEYFDITRDTLLAIWSIPKGKEDFKVSNPTMLAHVSGYAESNDDKSPYSIDDCRVPLLRELIHWKVNQFIETRDTLMRQDPLVACLAMRSMSPSYYSELRALTVIKGFLRQVSHARPERIDSVWNEIGRSWDEQTLEVKRTWYIGFTLLQMDYADWLTHLQDQIKNEDHFLVEIFNEVLQFVI